MMRKLLFISCIMLLMASACKKDKSDDTLPQNGIVPEKTNVKTYEVITLTAFRDLATQYSATLGSESITLYKTSDSTLTFYIPDLPAGETVLTFELASIKFNVSKTSELDPDQLLADLAMVFDGQLGSIITTTPEEIAEIDSMYQFQQQVMSLFTSMSPEQKRQAALFYEANKEVFKSFSSSTYANLDANTSYKQSDCPQTDFKTFYTCTAQNLGNAANELKNPLKKFTEMLVLAGAMGGVAYNTSVLGPVAWGITAVGITLPLGAAGYLLLSEVRPAVFHLKTALIPFLKANWIFGKGLFNAPKEIFYSDLSASLNLDPSFQSITPSNSNVNQESTFFVTAISALNNYWVKLTSFLGIIPGYNNTETQTTLATSDVSVSNISNPNVSYLGNAGQSLKFKTLSGNEENFTYNIRVAKEGFVEEKTLTARVTPAFDSIAYYTAMITGEWTLNFGSSSEKQFYVFDNTNMTFLQTGGVDGGGTNYTSHECMSDNYTWEVYQGTSGYCVRLNKVYESRVYLAFITGGGDLEFLNAFNTCSPCFPPTPCW